MEIIEKGANEFWLEIDDKAWKKRQKILDKLVIQLQTENIKLLKISKSKVTQKPYFHTGDILAVKFDDEYGVCFVSSVDERPRKLEYNFACMMQNTSYCLKTDCWFNHKDLGLILNKFEKIGKVELEDYVLGILSPASTLEDIYHQITQNKKISRVKLKDTSNLIRSFEVAEKL